MQYPTQWKLSEKEHYADHPDEKWNQVIGLSSPSETNLQSEKENFAIYVKRLLSPNMSLHEYVEKQISHLVRKSSLLESAPTTFAGYAAHKVVYTDNKGYQRMEIWEIKDDSVYIIRYVAKPMDYGTYLPDVQKMLDSFKITE